MKFLVDAQLPWKLSDWLNKNGHDSIHTFSLVEGNATGDADITLFADQEDRIVVSKDSDFWDDHLLNGRPRRLLIVKTGNIQNGDLIALFDANISQIESAFQHNVLVELTRTNLIVHA